MQMRLLLPTQRSNMIMNGTRIPLLRDALLQSIIWEKTIKETTIYKEIQNNTEDIKEETKLFQRMLEDLPTYKINGKDFHKVLIQKHRIKP